MKSRLLLLLPWLSGVALLVALVVIFSPENLWVVIGGTGISGIAIWAGLTVTARLIQAQTTVLPVNALGYHIRLRDAFWIGWIRTFANQLVPVSGVAAYAKIIRQKTNMNWSELASLAAPQFVLAAAALGLVGIAATSVNMQALGELFVTLSAVFVVLLLVSIALIRGVSGFIGLFPKSLSTRLEKTALALQTFATRRGLLMTVVSCHAATILLRGGRLWLLFAAAGVALDWNQVLLVVAVAESSLLIQLTPGGLGIRESAVLVGAALVGIPADVAISVALIDRLLVIGITVFLTPPAIVFLRQSDKNQTG